MLLDASLTEISGGFFMLVWLVKIFVRRHNLPGGMMPSPKILRCYLTLTPIPGFFFLAGFLLFIGLQHIPMPRAWVQQISPKRYALYGKGRDNNWSRYPIIYASFRQLY